MPTIKIDQDEIYYYHHPDQVNMSLLMIHGAGGDHTLFPIASLTQGINIYALDLPGHGRSKGSNRPTIEGYADFIEDFVKRLGLQKVTVCGHSMGGAIAMTLALRKLPWIDKLILVGTGARLKVNPLIFQLIKDAFENAIQTTAQFLYGPKASPEMIQIGQQSMRKISPQVLMDDFRACDHFNVMEKVREINTPTLVIVGDSDQMTPPKYSQYLAQHIPNAQMLVIEEAGHMVALERPEEFTGALEKFLFCRDVPHLEH